MAAFGSAAHPHRSLPSIAQAVKQVVAVDRLDPRNGTVSRANISELMVVVVEIASSRFVGVHPRDIAAPEVEGARSFGSELAELSSMSSNIKDHGG